MVVNHIDLFEKRKVQNTANEFM